MYEIISIGWASVKNERERALDIVSDIGSASEILFIDR